MARLAAEDGVRGVIATPHHADGLHRNPPDRILAGLRLFRRALRRAGLGLRVAAGAEVRLQPDVADMAARGETLLLGPGGRGLLLELPDGVRLADAARPLFQLRLRGVTPIIAHVERLREVQADVESLEPLLRMGVLTQGTAGALLGQTAGDPLGQTVDGRLERTAGDWSAAAQEAARVRTRGAARGEARMEKDERRALVRLLRRGCVHFLASDGHGAARRRPLLRAGVREAARIMGDERAARALVLDNPVRLLWGLPMRPWAAPAGRRFWFLRPPWRWLPRPGSSCQAGGAA